MTWAVRQSGLVSGFFNNVISPTSNTLSGSLLLGLLTVQTSNTAPAGLGVSDPTNGAWVQLGTPVASPDANNNPSTCFIFYKLNAGIVTTAQSVSLNETAGDGMNFTFAEVTGLATASALDPTTYGSTTGNATSTVGGGSVTDSLTTSNANDLYVIVCGAVAAQTSTFNTPTGWTLLKTGSGGGSATGTFYLTSTAQAAGTVSVTVASTTAGASIEAKMGAFIVAGGGGGSPIELSHLLLLGCT